MHTGLISLWLALNPEMGPPWCYRVASGAIDYRGHKVRRGSASPGRYVCAAASRRATAEVAGISTGPEATVATPHIEAVPIAEGRGFSGPTVCRWYDPTIGEYLPALRRPNRSGSPFANTGDRQFAPPDKNHDGDGDWVLVLEAG